MRFIRKKSHQYLCWLSAIWIVNATSCTHDTAENISEELNSAETISAMTPSNPRFSQKIDQSFCEGHRPASCFSLILRIPQSESAKDLGLSILRLGAQAPHIRPKLDQACTAAWSEYRRKYANDHVQRLRRSFVRTVEKMRCIYDFGSDEIATEDAPLADNETGLSVALTKFELIGSITEQPSNDASLRADYRKTQTAFHKVFIYSGRDVNPARGVWDAGLGFYSDPVVVSSNLERKIQWRWDGLAILTNIQQISSHLDGSRSETKSFVEMAEPHLRPLNVATNNAPGALAMVGVGYNIFRSICGDKRQICRTQNSPTAGFQADLPDLVPASDTMDLLQTAAKNSIQSILDGVFAVNDTVQLQDSFKLN